MFLHHSGKNLEQRGTSKREDVVDAVLKLTAKKAELEDETSKESKFDLEFTKHREFYGRDAEPSVLSLSMNRDGLMTWTRDSARSDVERQIQELLERDFTQQEIAKTLNLSKSWVSEITKRLKQRDGIFKGFTKRAGADGDDDNLTA